MDELKVTHPTPLPVGSALTPTGAQILRQGTPVRPADVTDSEFALVATFTSPTKTGVCVVDGQGLRLTVDRGHLNVADGFGPHRRSRRFARATHGLSRLVVLGGSGFVTLDVLQWCDRLEVPLLVLDPSQARSLFASVPKGLDDARLRRAQALASDSGLGLAIVRELLGAKLRGQEALLRDRLQVEAPAATIDALAEALEGAESVEEARQLEASAAACYWQAWTGHPAAEVRYARRDLPRIPEHWRRYDGRRSVLMSGNGNRRSERPLNALLNYLFALAEMEATLACQVLGLDPGLGFVHKDARSRPSLALDLMEPIRPLIEGYVLEMVKRRSFLRRDFSEAADGHVRLMAPLTHELAETLPRWRQAVGPWAERVALLLGQAIEGKWQATAPLTGAHRKQAQERVRIRSRSREASARTLLTLAGQEGRPRQRPPDTESAITATCRQCGQVIPGRFRRYCPACGVLLPGQDPESRTRRSVGISATRAELERWRTAHPGTEADPDEFRTQILPGLAGVKLSVIMAAIGCAKSTASMIRSGRYVPALRHWARLAAL